MPSLPLRVLLIEDDESDALLTRTLLEILPGTRAESDWVTNAEDGLAALLRRNHDVCLLDYHLGADSGLGVLRRARAMAVQTPVILLTGKGSREVDLEAMHSGAEDYLQKGAIDPETLERALRYTVERHRAQEELRRSEERNRGMFDHLPLGLFRVTPQGDYLEANPALIRILEHPDRVSLTEERARDFFVHADDRERLLAVLAASGSVTGFETHVESGRGRRLRLRVHARIHRSPAGVAEYIEGAVEDLTGSPSAHEVEEEASTFRVLSRVLDVGLVRADPDGKVVWANDNALAYLGQPIEMLKGRGIWAFFHPDDEDRVARACQEVSAEGRERSVREVRVLRADGSEEARRLTLAAVPGRGGGVDALIASIAPLS